MERSYHSHRMNYRWDNNNNNNNKSNFFDVAIIGSGPAGLVTAKTLLVDQNVTNIVVFEETSSAGGLWNRETTIAVDDCSTDCRGTTPDHADDGDTMMDVPSTTIVAPTPHVLRQDVPCIIQKDGGGVHSEIGRNDVGSDDDNNKNENGSILPPPSQQQQQQQQQQDGITIRISSSSQPVYDDLRPNFPKDMTSFLGYPFPSTLESFPPASEIDSYYKGYSRHFGVDRVTKYYTRVVDCRKENNVTEKKSDKDDGSKIDANSPSLWTIDTVHTLTGDRLTFRARRVVVCNGHFRKAFAPYVPGLEHFKGQLLHSSSFRSVVDLQDKNTILIVGGSISGTDISNKVLAAGFPNQKVVLSVREWKISQDMLIPRLKKRGLIVRPRIDHIDHDGRVHFGRPVEGTAHKYNDDVATATSSLQPDVILFATGYRYYFPFLKKPVHGGGGPPHVVRDDGYKMEGLYRRIVSVEDPSLAFIGVTNINFSPAIVMEYQARWYGRMVIHDDCRYLNNNKKVMVQEIESRKSDMTQDALALKFPSYCNSLAADIGVSGYWTQVICYRLPLFLRTIWVQYWGRHSGSTVVSTHSEINKKRQ